jgi:hypothetical protein
MEKVEPCPTSLCTEMVPLWRRTTSATMRVPNPVPPALVEIA